MRDIKREGCREMGGLKNSAMFHALSHAYENQPGQGRQYQYDE